MPSIPRLETPLADCRVVLRDAAERDIPEILVAHQDDPTMYVRLGFERPPSGAELGRQMEDAESERAAGTRTRLTILEANSDDFRGRILVDNLDWENSRAELGVWVVPQARGRGLGRAALRLAAQWLFDTCGLLRVQLLTEPDNEPLLHAARGAGFTQEGVLRSYTKQLGRRHDMVTLSLVPSDLEQNR